MSQGRPALVTLRRLEYNNYQIWEQHEQRRALTLNYVGLAAKANAVHVLQLGVYRPLPADCYSELFVCCCNRRRQKAQTTMCRPAV